MPTVNPPIELKERQDAFKAALDAFLADPENEEIQTGLAKQMNLFRLFVLQKEAARLKATGAEESMTDIGTRVEFLYEQLDILPLNQRAFLEKHTVILENLHVSLLHKIVETSVLEKQQAVAVNMLNGYFFSKIRARYSRVAYLLLAAFAVSAFILIALGLNLAMPLLAPGVGLGLLAAHNLVLAPALALGLAASTAVLSLASIFLMFVAGVAARYGVSFFDGLRFVRRKISDFLSFSPTARQSHTVAIPNASLEGEPESGARLSPANGDRPSSPVADSRPEGGEHTSGLGTEGVSTEGDSHALGKGS